MLIAKVTSNAGGFLLAGDSLDLNSLHESLHAVCPNEEEDSANPDNLILQLAYEVRKAKDGQRETISVPCDWPRKGKSSYRGATLSFPRAIIQFAFLTRLMCRSRSISTAAKADIWAFGAATISALEQLEIKNAERLLGSAVGSVLEWKGWPSHCLIDSIDITHLYRTKTRSRRIAGLKRLPTDLRERGPIAGGILLSSRKYAEEHGIPLDAVGVAWPEEMPVY
jgi:hypothetical protein